MNEEERLKAQAALVQMQDKYFMLGFDKAISKACEWLCMNMTSIEYFGINGNIIKPDFIQRFKKAMKGE